MEEENDEKSENVIRGYVLFCCVLFSAIVYWLWCGQLNGTYNEFGAGRLST